jgi:hypothetical protein
MPYTFVPWGVMSAAHQGSLALPPPTRFCDAGAVASPMAWAPWVEATANDMARWLWPRWTGSVWSGASAAGAVDLTLADLQVMDALSSRLKQPAPGAPGVTSEQLFRDEDLQPPTTTGLAHYLNPVPALLGTHFKAWLIEAVMDFGLNAAMQLKLRMQRPRPYQTALAIRPAAPFVHLRADSATTPALVSGHCIQASLALVNVVIRYEQALGTAIPPAELSALQAYLIGAGDRRVLAGVHYPTDNVSSWYCALKLCRNLLFATTPGNPATNDPLKQRARQILWDAIVNHSAVYAEVVAEAATRGSPYAPVLARLQAEAVPP